MKKINSNSTTRGFSLVEVAMALAIASFCLLTLLGLLTVGLHNYQQAGSRTTMVDLSTAVIQDLNSTTVPATGTPQTEVSPRYQITVPAAGVSESATAPQKTIFVDANGTVQTSAANALYRISVACYPPISATSKAATVVRVVVTFPAQADPTATTWPVNYSSMFQTMVSLNRN